MSGIAASLPSGTAVTAAQDRTCGMSEMVESSAGHEGACPGTVPELTGGRGLIEVDALKMICVEGPHRRYAPSGRGNRSGKKAVDAVAVRRLIAAGLERRL